MKYLTLGEAEREVGVTKSTISRAIKDGRLSANRNEHGHFQIDPAELFRVYPPIDKTKEEDPAVYDMRNTTQQAVQHHATPENTSNESDEMVSWLRDRLDQAEEKLEQTESTLAEKERAMTELREAYNALPSPDDFDAKLKKELDRVEDEKNKLIAMQKQEEAQRSEKWKAALSARKKEVEAARSHAEVLEQQRAAERKAREMLSQRLADIESRGFFARLLNRRTKVGAG